MADPTPDPRLVEASGDPDAFQVVYSALMTRYESSIRLGHMTEFADEVTAFAVQVLHRDGRLQPPGGQTRTEWAVRVTLADGTELLTTPGLAAATTKQTAERAAAALSGHGWTNVVRSEPVFRVVGTGPWQPVPTEGADAR